MDRLTRVLTVGWNMTTGADAGSGSDAADAEVDGILGQRRQRARRRFFQSVLEDDDRGVLEGIEAGAPLNQVNTDGETPLLVAAKRGYERIVRILLDAGANLDTRKAPLFATALYWAVARGHTDIALLLIERGANVAITTAERDGPLAEQVAQDAAEADRHAGGDARERLHAAHDAVLRSDVRREAKA